MASKMGIATEAESLLELHESQKYLEEESKSDDQNYLYMFHCVRHTNGGKLSSHLWFF